MAKPLTSWLVPRFLQHNLRLVVSKRCLHVSVTKFQDKFTSLRRVNNPNSWQTFQTCCTDMYFIRFLPNFAVFCVFLWISRLCDPREISEALTVSFTNGRLELCIWRLFFSGWSPKGDLRIFLISSPEFPKKVNSKCLNDRSSDMWNPVCPSCLILDTRSLSCR